MATATPESTPVLSLSALKGEWTGDVFAGVASADNIAQKHRYLVLRGTLRNVGSDSLSRIMCPASVTVQFSNGNTTELSTDDVCGDTAMLRTGAVLGMGDASSLANLTLLPGTEHAFGLETETAAIAAKFGSGLALSGKYAPYPVRQVRLRIDYTAETAFGERVQGRLVEAGIPLPTETAMFEVVR